MSGYDTKISNILGTKLPEWLINQLRKRSAKLSQDTRDNDNILFLANRSAWVRLVSSVNISSEDLLHFQKENIVGSSLNNPEDLAKQFVLFGGTSKYLNQNSYQQRSGLGKDGSYGMLGETEIQQYGYRPMPGIQSVTIDTQGKLGSLRLAIVNFKCWDKAQLDIIDALYFKLGFTMFLEWGHTLFYPNASDNVESTETYSIDPFRSSLTKEQIALDITKSILQSDGNYDAMLGMVTNFTFSYNQEGGYDCQLKIMGLGVLGDSIKINIPTTLPSLLPDEILNLNNTLQQLANEEARKAALEAAAKSAEEKAKQEEGLITAEQLINKYVKYDPQTKAINPGFATYASNAPINFKLADLSFTTPGKVGNIIVIRRLNGFLSLEEDLIRLTKVQLDGDRILQLIGVTGLNLKSTSSDAWASLDSQLRGAIPDRGELQKVRSTWNWNSKTNGINYELSIARSAWAKTNEPNATQKEYPIFVDEFADQFINVIKTKNNSFDLISIDYEFPSRTTEPGSITFTVKIGVPFTRTIEIQPPAQTNVYQQNVLPPKVQVSKEVVVDVEFSFQDSSFIRSFQINSANVIQPKDFVDALNSQNQTQTTTDQDQSGDNNPTRDQISAALRYQSGLELALRTIQISALNRALQKTGADIGKTVFPFRMAEYNVQTNTATETYYKQIFSNGVFSDFIEQLVAGKINDTDTDLFKVQSKYGFATELMAGRATIDSIKEYQVNFVELLTAYVLPYNISQEITLGISTTHPVYIPFGLLIMLLNHMCSIYDSPDKTSQSKPLVYVDFNPDLNLFLSNRQHLSTNPFKILIPYEGSFEDYKKLFPRDILTDNGNGDAILPVSGSTQNTPLFNKEKEDAISALLPKVKYDKTSNNAYRGRLMNVLLNIDYVIEVIRDNSTKSGKNSVYLKPFLEQILLDLNKHLGDFNVFRLAYNDGANTFHIVDDQVCAPLPGDKILEPNNSTEIPLVGKTSLAKTLEIKSEVSTKLANMIAISANSDVQDKALLSQNGDSFGFINTAYKDRYIPIKGELSKEEQQNIQNEKKRLREQSIDGLKNAAIQFNTNIGSYYSTDNLAEGTVNQATNYYIKAMTERKNDELATRAAPMIPVSVNFTMDGIAGLTMGQAFSISDKFLPYTYNNRSIQKEPGLDQSHLNKVGFTITGLTNTIENNQWTTAVKGNMIFLKTEGELEGKIDLAAEGRKDLRVRAASDISENESIPVKNTTFVGTNAEAKKVAEAYLGKSITDQEWSQLVAATFAEASSDQQERAWVMAVILNRTRTKFLKAQTITDTLTRKRQFQAVTGTSANNYQPSSNYANGPNKTQADSIYGAVINFLPKVPKNYLYFTSNVVAAYGPGTNIAFLDKLKSLPDSKIIGKTVFATTA